MRRWKLAFEQQRGQVFILDNRVIGGHPLKSWSSKKTPLPAK
jgi:hypothetical protein